MSNTNKNTPTENCLKIGITGGIGSGKTTVCKIFETFGIPVYYADDRAKWLMMNDLDVITKLKSLFGKQTYLENGALNRAYIAGIVFQDKEILKKLNSIVHPAVYLDGNKWHNEQKKVSYTLKEAALLFEGNGYKLMDKVITVFAPKEVRIDRVMKRDNTDRAAVEARIDKQMPDKKKVELADFVIYNDGSKSLVQQVFAVHQALIIPFSV